MAKKKLIEAHTDEELVQAMKAAEVAFPLFWVVTYGIHAFLEQRRRKMEALKDRREGELRRMIDEEMASETWGSTDDGP